MTSTAAIDTAEHVAAGRIDALLPDLIATRRELARLQAREARLLADAQAVADEWADVDRSNADFAHRSIAAEVATAWRVSDRTIQRRMADAAALVERFPATWSALDGGRISFAHARAILEAGIRITQPELRAEFEDSVLPYAEAESAARLAPVAKRRAEWFLDESIDRRHSQAHRGRSVTVTDFDDGMAELRAPLPAAIAHGVLARLTAMARDVQQAERDQRRAARERGLGAGAGPADAESTEEGPDAPRTLDQLRADILADLLLAGVPVAHAGTTPTGLGAIRATVQVTVPVLALLDDRVNDPFEAVTLGGFGPVDVETAKSLAAGAPGWDRILTHPITGAVLGVDRHQPTEQMRRHLRVRDEHCRFPGCRLAADRTDIDHTVDRQYGGPTKTGNLAHLCRRHHCLKHATAWTVVQRPGGVLEWTSPTGRVHRDRPVSSVSFSTDREFDQECDPAPF